MENSDLLVKMILKSGQAFNLIAESKTVDEMLGHPKFMRMRDNANDVFVSIEDISAFEILSFRKPDPVAETKSETVPEENGQKKTQEEKQ